VSCEHTRHLELLCLFSVSCDTEEMQWRQLYHVDDYINFLYWLYSALHCLFLCYKFAHSSISHKISHIFAYFTKTGSSSQWRI